MILCRSISDIRSQLQADTGQSIGFVATMGNLHQGHLQLVKRAQQLVDKVVVSIYVNPLQFNQSSDFDNYPRSLVADQQLLEDLSVDILFIPETDELYPHGQESNCKVIVPGLGDILEGEHRPGHFVGVTTIVNKLFNIIQPDIALFGEKDFQQLMLIRRMVSDLNQPVQIEAVATCRHKNGLAMSSRNNRLSPEQQQQASVIYQQLVCLRASIEQGNRDYTGLQAKAIDELKRQGLKPEYVEIRRCTDLGELNPDDRQGIILIAAWLADVRLIDNMQVDI